MPSLPGQGLGPAQLSYGFGHVTNLCASCQQRRLNSRRRAVLRESGSLSPEHPVLTRCAGAYGLHLNELFQL